jgi:hypothetical protein
MSDADRLAVMKAKVEFQTQEFQDQATNLKKWWEDAQKEGLPSGTVMEVFGEKNAALLKRSLSVIAAYKEYTEELEKFVHSEYLINP